jgi:hypothetical protein
MGETLWCRDCGRSTNHVGKGGNFWTEAETGDLVYVCGCGHHRTRDKVELEAGTLIEIRHGNERKKAVELVEDGYVGNGQEVDA